MFSIANLKKMLLMVAVLLVGCDQSQEKVYQPSTGNFIQAKNEYIVGIHPLHNPQRLMEVYGPIVDYMNAHISGKHFVLEASRNYEEFEKKLYAGHFAFAMPNPYQTLRATEHGYRIFGKMGDDENFCGLIIVRKDSGIHRVSDLKGKIVAYPAATALAAAMMPQYFLYQHGLDVNRDIENRYVGSQESAIMNAYQRLAAAGATWPIPWKKFLVEHPDKAAELEVKWETKPLLNNGWVVRKDMPEPLIQQFSDVLFHLQNTEAGKKMLAQLPISHFEAANDATYQPVRDFLVVFSKTVRPLE